MRRFYNPELPPEEADDLDLENILVLSAVQAFLGIISPNFVAVAVEAVSSANAVARIVLRESSAADYEAIGDAVGDLDVLLEGRTAIRVEMIVAPHCPSELKSPPNRLIFLAAQ